VGVLAASGWSAISAVAVMAVAARVLSTADYTQLLVYYSALFGCFQVLTGIQNESSRAVGAAALTADASTDSRPARVATMALILAGSGVVILLLLSPLWAPYVGVRALVVTVSAVVLVAYSCFLALVGALAGRHQWGTMTVLFFSEPTVRVVVVAAIAFSLPSLTSLQLALALPALAWLVVTVALRPARSVVLARGDVSLRRLLSNGLLAMLAAGAAAVLINGFPAIARAALGSETPGLAAILLGVQLTRAPVMVPLGVFQSIAIAGFVANQRGRLAALAKPVVGVVVVGVVLAVAAALVGPWIMALIFGPNYVLAGWALGCLTFATVSVALLTLSGTATIAVGAHRAYLIGWVLGAGATVALLFALPLVGVGKVIVAVLVGPLLGASVHLFAIRRTGLADDLVSQKGASCG